MCKHEKLYPHATENYNVVYKCMDCSEYIPDDAVVILPKDKADKMQDVIEGCKKTVDYYEKARGNVYIGDIKKLKEALTA